jgi:hypothetical protein
VSLADDEVELLELPAEFDGLPYHTRRKAFGVAESMLDVAAIIDALGQAEAENALSQAAAHYLATTGSPNARPRDQPAPRKGVQVGEGGDRGLWAGSPYGDNVSRILDRMPSGAHRCGRHPAPAPA